MSNHFFFGTEMNAIENHIAPLLRNLAANVLKWYKNRSTHMFVYIFLMPLVMAGCTRKYFLCITFGCPYNITRRDKAHSQEWLDWADEQADLMPFWVHRSFSWFVSRSSLFSFSINHHQHFFLPKAAGGARWLSGRVSDSGARGRGFETYRRRVVSLSKTLYSPKVLVNYPGSGGSVPTWLKNCWLGR